MISLTQTRTLKVNEPGFRMRRVGYSVVGSKHDRNQADSHDTLLQVEEIPKAPYSLQSSVHCSLQSENHTYIHIHTTDQKFGFSKTFNVF